VGKSEGISLIEFRRPEHPKHDREYHVFVDGLRVEGLRTAGVVDSPKEENYLRIIFDKSEAQKRILAQPISAFPRLAYFYFNLENAPFDLITDIRISPKSDSDSRYCVAFISEPDLSAWSRPYSFAAYSVALAKAFEEIDHLEVDFGVYDNKDAGFKTSFGVEFIYSSLDVPIA